MADSFLLEIVTPYRKLLSKEVDELIAPGVEGEFGVLAGHTPYIVLLRAGALTFKKGSEVKTVAIGRGYAEVSHAKSSVLVENAEYAEEIDAEAAREALNKAEEALKSGAPGEAAYEAAAEAKELAEARLMVKEKREPGGKGH